MARIKICVASCWYVFLTAFGYLGILTAGLDISRKLPDIHLRLWPARFTLNEEDGAIDQQYEGCYLVGLKKLDNSKKDVLTDYERRRGQEVLRACLDRFQNQIRNDEKYFDPGSSWVTVDHVGQSDLGNLRQDTSEWGIDTGKEASDVLSQTDQTISEPTESTSEVIISPPKIENADNLTFSTRPGKARKLRPASDVLHRLRWDPCIDSSSYVIGYEDRFLGIRETALDTWKTEQTDEEFIPQHRIMYFREKDGLVVWDRREKKDEIFGSGFGQGQNERG